MRIQGAALRFIKIVPFVLHHEVQHGSFGQQCRLIDEDAAARNLGANEHAREVTISQRGSDHRATLMHAPMESSS